ncbi:MAG: DUF2313 domain-containing protein [Ruminococcaceae bacterium]|nr:DUF2313 domain-containing protein [Oscillospiraceae bacterium]
MKKYLDYLPDLFSQIPEFCNIAFACDAQTEKLYHAQNELLESQFISTASPQALTRYENMLGLPLLSSIESRRLRLTAIFSDKPPYSYGAFIAWLDSVCGKDGYTVEFSRHKLQLYIRIALSKLSAFDDIARRCRLMIPANIQLDIMPMFATHSFLSEATHALLALGSHEQTKTLVKETV